MGRIAGFDGLRALAATSVVLTHLGLLRGLAGTPLLHMVEGFQAVHLFFALSGFLITALLIREHNQHGAVSVRFFYARRLFRIFPLYFLCLGVVALLQVTVGSVTNNESLLYSATYMYNFMPRIYWSGQLDHTWSLAVEEHFYLLWPLAFVLLYPKYKRAFLGCCVFVCLLAILTHIRLGIELRKQFCVAHWTCFSGTSILFGCIVAVLSCDADFSPRASRLLRTRAALALGLLLWANSLIPWLQISVLPNYMRGAGFAVLIGWIYHNQGGRAVRLLELRPLRYLGTISYGIYMYQGLFLTGRPERVPGQAWPLSPWVGVLLLCVVAPLSYRFLEQPLLRFGRRFRVRSSAAPTPCSAGSPLAASVPGSAPLARSHRT